MFKSAIIIFVVSLLMGTTLFGNIIEKNFDNKTINSVLIDCPASTHIVLGNENSIMINGDKAALSNVYTDVKNKTLRVIGNSKGSSSSYQKVTVSITVKELSRLENLSSGKLHVSSAKKLNDLEILNKGTASINIDSLHCDKLKLELKGESEFASAGSITASEVQIDLDSKTKLSLHYIEAGNIILNDNSKKNIELNTVVADKELKLKISSFGGVNIERLAVKNLTVNSDRMGYFKANVINKFESENINLSLKSAGVIFLNGINAKKLNVDIGSSGDLKINGEVDKQYIKMRGSGSLYAHELKSKDLDIVNYDVGNAYVYATNKAKIKIRGCGDIYLYGNPTKTKDLRGCLGKLKKIVD
jgi:hypothetical protein